MNSRSKDNFYAKEKNPLMEKKLCEEFLELRKKGTSVKTQWFTFRGYQVLNDPYLEMEFKFSDHSDHFPREKEYR